MIIGKNDLVIKKKEKKEKSSCKQSTLFNYYGIENALLDKRGNFDIQSIVAFKTMNENEMKYQIELNQLEKWSGMQCGEIIFDSEKDNWNEESSVFNDRIIGKKSLTFLIEDEDGERFGYYFNNRITEQYNEWISTTNKSFLFNLHSKEKRLAKPMRFEILNKTYGGIVLYPLEDDRLISLGDILIRKKDDYKQSHIIQSSYFQYHDENKALCGKLFPERYIPIKIKVIQMI